MGKAGLWFKRLWKRLRSFRFTKKRVLLVSAVLAAAALGFGVWRFLPFGKLLLQVGGIQRADDVALAYRVAHLHKDLLDGIGERRGDVCHASALHRARDGDAL